MLKKEIFNSFDLNDNTLFKIITIEILKIFGIEITDINNPNSVDGTQDILPIELTPEQLIQLRNKAEFLVENQPQPEPEPEPEPEPNLNLNPNLNQNLNSNLNPNRNPNRNPNQNRTRTRT